MTARPAPDTPITSGLVIRAVLKAVILFGIFNLLYLAVNPLDQGRLPTIYNSLVPGRTRFGFSAGYEYNIQRLLADHVISQAQSDHYNVIVFGSSEIWGVTSVADETIIDYLDRMELATSDNRPVRIYNLAYPRPDLFKDLLIWEALRQSNLPIDLILLTASSGSFANGAFSDDTQHPLITENGLLIHQLMDRYHLSDSMLLAPTRSSERFFGSDRQDIAAWIRSQVLSVPWTLMRQDSSSFRILEPLTKFRDGTNESMPSVTRYGILEAFSQSSQEAQVPLVVLSVPIASINNPFEDWIIDYTDQVHLPLLNCTTVLDRPEFFGDGIHELPTTHPIFASVLAYTLTQPELASVDTALPFTGALKTEKICDFYPASRSD